ncbi:hypothetical protein [Alkalicoccobacillus plakortidis]|uniref:Lipoprotein n=1 Tax=Alkalicoccobacillus plakortidis TaxID=444060 RepID=A0ABT0XLT4_9BACI|nr:hypothetical protein [Alkalicoccobacillus plakortidis]MCM2676879.1 hypothetical protein [Alkalicoccobacillus plakortidis]
MKKFIGFAIPLTILIFISACSNSSEEETIHKENVTLTIKNNSDVKMNGIEIKGYENGHLKSNQGSSNADGSDIKKGESLVFQFEESELDFIEDVSFEISLLENEDTKAKITSSKDQFDKVEPSVYYFELTDTIK